MKPQVRFLVEEAGRFLDAALEEFQRGVREGRDEVIRDAAEKGWNSIVQATTALLIAKGFDEEAVKTYRQKRLALEELSAKDEEVKELGLRDRFMAREYTLHLRCFYDGEYTIDTVREELGKTKKFIDDVAGIVRGAMPPASDAG